MRVTADVLKRWSIGDSAELYSIRNWGLGYFGVNDGGHIVVNPAGDNKGSIDLKELVDELVQRGIAAPLLIRFNDILRSRVETERVLPPRDRRVRLQGALQGRLPDQGQPGPHVVEEIVDAGEAVPLRPRGGLQARAARRHGDARGRRGAHRLQRLQGRGVHRDRAARAQARPHGDPRRREADRARAHPRGLEQDRREAASSASRAKLSTRGAGKWESSGGDRSKFGLSSREMVEAVAVHAESTSSSTASSSSTSTSARRSPRSAALKNAMREAAASTSSSASWARRSSTSTSAAASASTTTARRRTIASSMNYTMQEYANDVVYGVKEICDAEKRAAPDHRLRVRPRGRRAPRRARRQRPRRERVRDQGPGHAARQRRPDRPQPVRDLQGESRAKNFLEAYHDAVEYKDECLALFNLGHLSLEQRVLAENLFWAICQKVLQDRARAATTRPKSSRASRRRSRTRTSATSRCSSRCPTRGPSISCSRSCRSTG